MKRTMSVLARFDEIELSQKIGILFILNKIYLQKDLNADSFAEKIGIKTRWVAPVFGTLYGHRFKELANIYRVEYAKNKIEAGYLNGNSLVDLSDASGFNSPRTFAGVFRKEFGKYPKEYARDYLLKVS